MKTNKTPLLFLICCIVVFLTQFKATAQQAKEQFVVVLDAGHGGKDHGNLGSGYKEKKIALNIVLQVGEILEQHKSIKVIYTRKTDVFLELHERAAIANKADADLFVSVHCNAHNSSANGTETFVLGLHANKRNFEIAKKENEVIYMEDNHETHYEGFDPNSPESLIGLTLMQEEYLDQSIALANLVEKAFVHKLKRKSRGVKQAGFWVLHNTYMPSVLIETGFLTYKKEGAYLNSKAGQTKMSTSIAKAILDYKSSLEQNTGDFVVVPEPNKDAETVADTPKADAVKTETVVDSIYPEVKFKVQIAAGSTKIDLKPYNFRGLDDITLRKKGKIYRYFYGNTSNYSKIQQMQKQAKAKGYVSCYIVAYKSGQRISVGQALKTPVK